MEVLFMKVGQFNYKQQTGLATIFTAESEEEIKMLEKLKTLIEDGEGVLSRKSFSFEDGIMSIDIDKKQTKSGASTPTATTPANKGTGNKGTGKNDKAK